MTEKLNDQISSGERDVLTEEGEPSHTLRVWYEYIQNQKRQKEWEKSNWKGKIGWLRKEAVRAAEAAGLRVLSRIGTIVQLVGTYGPLVRSEHQISLIRQFLHLCYLVTENRLVLPKNYYLYQLYLPKRWRCVDEFIWDRPYRRVLHKKSPLRQLYEDEEVLDDKWLFFERCKRYGISTPPVLAVFENGTVIKGSVSDQSLPKTDLFIKERSGTSGRGARKYVYEKGRYLVEEDSYNAEALVAKLKGLSQGGEALILQPCLQNHSDWSSFSSGGVTTVRIVTGRSPQNEIEPLLAVLRMPVGGSVTDNFSKGGIVSPISLGTGRLGVGRSKLREDKIPVYERHPNTNQQLSGTELPRWSSVKELACRAHKAFDTIFIAWDISLTENGFTVIEGNWNWGVKSLQVPHGNSLQSTRFSDMYDAWMSCLATEDVKGDQ